MCFEDQRTSTNMALEQTSVPVNGRGGRSFPGIKNRELKERAIAFYGKHKVTDALEKLLNELFLAAPTDVYGYMVRNGALLTKS